MPLPLYPRFYFPLYFIIPLPRPILFLPYAAVVIGFKRGFLEGVVVPLPLLTFFLLRATIIVGAKRGFLENVSTGSESLLFIVGFL